MGYNINCYAKTASNKRKMILRVTEYFQDEYLYILCNQGLLMVYETTLLHSRKILQHRLYHE